MVGSNVTGSCLCGRVSFAISGHLGIFQYCHCSRCRKAGGGAFSANLFVAPADFHWTDGESWVGTFHLESAKYFGTAFCRQCGGALPWAARGGKAIVVPAGCLDEDPGVRPSQNIFCASRAVWYREPAELDNHDELPKRTPR